MKKSQKRMIDEYEEVFENFDLHELKNLPWLGCSCCRRIALDSNAEFMVTAETLMTLLSLSFSISGSDCEESSNTGLAKFCPGGSDRELAEIVDELAQ